MPPAAIASSDVVTSSSAPSPAPATEARRSSSRLIVCGNFGAPPKPPQVGSNSRLELLEGGVEVVGPGQVGGRLQLAEAVERLGELTGLGQEVGALGPPRVVDRLEQLHEPGLGVVGAAEERLARRA